MTLKQLREGRGFTQKEMAALCGINIRTYQNWEAGIAPVGIEAKVARKLDEYEGKHISQEIGALSWTEQMVALKDLVKKKNEELAKKDAELAKKDELINRLMGLLEKKARYEFFTKESFVLYESPVEIACPAFLMPIQKRKPPYIAAVRPSRLNKALQI